jgi:hypothetical protein
MDTIYYVWRRSDGYVNSSANSMPAGFTGANGTRTTFEELGRFEVWKDAYDCIVKNRATEA